ncbi:phosphoribosylformylglycinamidine cyclo-ligase [Candidatus Rariloculus sp.]|uniref:phosphoribosylformylglycinamidine cyclo-ligase n=1 Tax=Candidatus Rariloculus sp. TaxID=3101265 RepID=UPI003D11C328
MNSNSTLTYKDAGVDIDAGDALVERIKEPVRRTLRPEVLGGLGGFGGLCRIPQGYRSPLLVAGADGVGTKLKLAIQHGAHDGVGIDLVAMCANDVVVQGAEPLFVLDYYVTPRLDVDVAARVIAGVARGCELAGAALLGGETAEHPGTHAADDYDLAGFCVGVVEEDELIDGSTITAGDAVIGLASSGPHSNGFSLIRKILEQRPGAREEIVDGRPLIEGLLEPTRIYVRSLLALFELTRVKGLAHITGGGLTQNIPRVLPGGLGVRLERAAWPRPGVFEWLTDAGVHDSELYRTFNCGIGMIVIVADDTADSAVASLEASGERAWIVGSVVEDGCEGVDIV